MKDEKKKLLFDIFCEKVKLVNPNLTFDIGDWIHNEKYIKGKCLKHDQMFLIGRSRLKFHINCPKCKDMSKENVTNLYGQFDIIDDKYGELLLKMRESVIEEKIHISKTISKPVKPVKVKEVKPVKIKPVKPIKIKPVKQVKIKEVKQKYIPKTIRYAVWNHYIGEKIAETKCPIACGRNITWQSFECGHIIARSKGGTIEVNNLVPICSTCNRGMGNKNLNESKKSLELEKLFDFVNKTQERS